MSEFTHTRHVEEAALAEEAPPKAPVAAWPFGAIHRVYCQDKAGEDRQYELAEYSAQRAVKAVIELDTEVVRAFAVVK